MSDAYERVRGGRLAFKGGALATRKSIEKKKKYKKKQKTDADEESQPPNAGEELRAAEGVSGDGGDIYSIDAAKKKKYEELFPVESKKFDFQPKSDFKSVEDALDDRVKKKADRYCK